MEFDAKGFAPILRELLHTVYFLVKWSVITLLVVGVALVVYMWGHRNDEIRRRVAAKLQSHYQNLQVTVDSAQLVEGEGIMVRGITILDPAAPGPQATLLEIGEMMLQCDTDIGKLITGEPQIGAIVVRRPVLHVTRRDNGRWSVSRLLPPPKFSDRPPQIRIEGAVVELFDPLKATPSSLTLRDGSLNIKPTQPTAAAPRGAFEVDGFIAGDHLQKVECRGRIDVGGDWTVGGTLTGLTLNQELRDALPGDWAQSISKLGPLTGAVKCEFQVQGDCALQTAPRVAINGQFYGGRWDDPRLPLNNWSEIEAKFSATGAWAAVYDLRARCGATTLEASGRRTGWYPGAPMLIDLNCQHLQLTDAWEEKLPPELRELWQKFRPSGEIDGRVRLNFDGQRWTPEVDVALQNVAFTYHKFPYRLERATGKLFLDKNRNVKFDMAALAGGQRVALKGDVQNPGPQFTGTVDISAMNVPYDENLLKALKPNQQKILASLQPRGNFTCVLHLEKQQPEQLLPTTDLTVTFSRGEVKYQGFPYPISDVCGNVQLSGGIWTFDVSGGNGIGRVTCRGDLRPVSEGHRLQVALSGQNMVVEEELRGALDPKLRRLWDGLQPRGTYDFEANVNFLAPSLGMPRPANPLDLQVTVRPRRETSSIAPTCFPYRMEKLDGEFVYRNRHVELKHFSAEHDHVQIRADGACDVLEDGRWYLRLSPLAIDRAAATDRDLLIAMPANMRRVINELNPTQPVDLGGMVEFWGGAQAGQPLQAAWNVDVTLHQNSVRCGIPLENISGTVNLRGNFDGQQARGTGELNIASLTFKQFQLTHIRGPFFATEKKITLGSLAEQNPAGGPGRHVTGFVYGGQVDLDCEVQRDSEIPRYSIQATLKDADLRRLALEQIPGQQRLQGRMHGGVSLTGEGMGVHSLQGKGELRLTEANIYELPLMVAMLNFLRIKLPDTNAFTSSRADFRIRADHLLIDHIEFCGDAISLNGKGDLGLNSDLHLRLIPTMGNSQFQLSSVKAFLGGAGEQIMRISVDGKLDDPKFSREMLPGFNEAFQQLGNETAQPIQGPPQHARQVEQQPMFSGMRNWLGQQQ